MQIHASDPAFTDSQRARANFRLAVKLTLGFVALIWFIQLLNWALDLGVEDCGVHVGAIGLIYGLVSYIFVAGMIRRDRRAIAASLLVSFLYGASVWGVLPIEPGVSWETHLAAALIGLVLALGLRRLDIP